MSDRERWMVYPLIFLTLGIALKDKLVEAIDVKYRNVFCNSLVVTDRQGRERVLVATDDRGGFLETGSAGSGLKVLVGNREQYAGLFFVDRKGGVHPGTVLQAPVQPPPAPPARQVDGVKTDRAPEVPPPEAETPPSDSPS